MKNAPNAEEFEPCVICGTITCIPVSMPIQWRENYEIGCGQVCVECARELQKETEEVNARTTARMMLVAKRTRKENDD